MIKLFIILLLPISLFAQTKQSKDSIRVIHENIVDKVKFTFSAIVTYNNKGIITTDTCDISVKSTGVTVFENMGQFASIPFGIIQATPNYYVLYKLSITSCRRIRNKETFDKNRIQELKILSGNEALQNLITNNLKSTK